MAIPTYEQIMLPLLELLKDENTYNNKECVEKLSENLNLTEEEVRELLPSGRKRVFYNRVNWAKTYLKRAGLVEAPRRGEVKITQLGLELLQENPIEIRSRDLLRYSSFNDFINTANNRNENNNENRETLINERTPFEEISISFEELKNSLADEILEKIKSCSFEFFEKSVIELLIKMGYGGSREEAGRATRRTGDEGIDGIINEDRLGLDSIYIQAKRWRDTVVGRPEIQKFSGALDTPGANKGVFITTSKFSREAKEYVENINTKKIILIDGMQLAQYMIDFNVGVSTEIVYEVKRIDSDYFIEE
ncbi:restriction endonuclease [Clostridium perfringens]|uniref:restriction endonuclease n=1 Tax=Clostridium perfringens TaxID=1502 RepID=UPI001A186A2E|nr:restriction endonuclease [Clostridium perfringens]ELC8354091.1 restriction endonuclease [Clostridium perfringens]ELC8355208.1 restriction endonuclease [Clostridium perfringens]MDN4737289.1 restriction endonuclease [Clostridium perfringens]MDN4740157.1 restriction endonuclease [Clostridium perfringens]HAT4289997.1 restriction endonuclease [Clostridium perfringens]